MRDLAQSQLNFMDMRNWKVALFLALLLGAVALAYIWPGPAPEPEMTDEQMAQKLAESHVSGNVPAAKELIPQQTRDLNLYFSSQPGGSATQKFDWLREGPTQVGLSYPKFYVWVQLQDGREAAVEVAAVNKQKFHVAEVFFATDITKDRRVMDGHMPAPVVEAALSRVRI